MGRLSRIEENISALQLTAAAIIPVGSIIAHLPGYFTGIGNGGFTAVSIAIPDNFKKCDGSEYFNEESPIFNAAGRFLPDITDDRFLSGSTTPGGIGGANSTTLSSVNLPPHTHAIDHNHGTHTHSGTTGDENATHTHIDGGHQHPFNVNRSFSGNGRAVVGLNLYSTYYTNIGYANLGTETAKHQHAFATGTAAVSFTGSSGNGGFSNNAIENRPKFLTVNYYMRVL